MHINEIIQGCIQCNPACQRRLFDLYAPTLMTVCRRYSSFATPAEDLIQETFIKIFHHIKQYDPNRGSIEGWMKRIAINIAISEWRKSHKNTWCESDLESLGMPELIQADHHLNEEELLALIDSLPAGYKIVFNLHAIEGYSHQEIAKELGISEGTSRSQLTHARKALRQLLSNDHPQNLLAHE